MATKLTILSAILFVLVVFDVEPALAGQVETPQSTTVVDTPHADTLAFPPLPPGCSGVGTPIEDYDTPVCCVSGYVYFEGAPVAGAQVIVAANGHTHTVQITTMYENTPPHFIASLDREPLALKPGDLVTVTATFQGQAASVAFVAQAGGQQVDIVIPKVAATWLAAPINPNDPAQIPPFTQWQGIGATYEQAGQYLLFGGLQGNPLFGSPQSDTFHWQQTHWERLTPATTPPARYSHALARNQNGDHLLMFGGIDSGGFYLDDTWLWDGNDWTNVQSDPHPTARAYTTLTYDSTRNVWVLFGGLDDRGVLSDTWELSEQTWLQRTLSTQPPPRHLASLTYDPNRQRTVLFGGRTKTVYYNDLWEWDGTGWAMATAVLTPTPRASHGATYDPAHKTVVIAGGFGTNGGVTDTWDWTGNRWLKRTANPSLPSMYKVTMDYDPVNQQIVAFGERVGGNQGSDGIWLHKVITATYGHDAIPIATIQHINQRDARQGMDTFALIGRGADGDATKQIMSYRWSHAAITLSTAITLSLPANTLPLGPQTLSLAVQDDEGNWSRPVTQTVFVRTGDTGAILGSQPTWALLVYVVADNNLAPRLGDNLLTNGLLYRLRTAGAQAQVQIGVLYDGPNDNDTRRYLLHEDGRWEPDQTSLPEADMGQTATLRDFVRWGETTFKADYVALALVGPANGVVGFGQDNHGTETGKVSFLTPIELRSALQAAIENRGRKLDILFFDGSSFGLLEDAAIVDEITNFMVVSPATSIGIYPYDQYRRLAANAITPRDFARAVAQQYAESATVYGLPFSVSVFDLNHFSPLQTAVGHLGQSLLAYIQQNANGRETVRQLRQNLSTYDSNGQALNPPDQADLYVDLQDLAATLPSSVTDARVQTAASAVAHRVQNFVIYQKNALGVQQMPGGNVYEELTHLGGVGIFYPPDTSVPPGSANEAYVRNRLFHITSGWGWEEFITSGTPVLPPCPPPECPPFLPDSLVLEPLSALSTEQIYLPFIIAN